MAAPWRLRYALCVRATSLTRALEARASLKAAAARRLRTDEARVRLRALVARARAEARRRR